MDQIDVKTLVADLGGPAEVARLCEMKNTQAISNWIARNRVPPSRLLYLRTVRPSAFDDATTTPKHSRGDTAPITQGV